MTLFRGDNQPTELTVEEDQLRQRIQNSLEKPQCDSHPVFYDVPGFPYDSRYCAVCKALINFL